MTVLGARLRRWSAPRQSRTDPGRGPRRVRGHERNAHGLSPSSWRRAWGLPAPMKTRTPVPWHLGLCSLVDGRGRVHARHILRDAGVRIDREHLVDELVLRDRSPRRPSAARAPRTRLERWPDIAIPYAFIALPPAPQRLVAAERRASGESPGHFACAGPQ